MVEWHFGPDPRLATASLIICIYAGCGKPLIFRLEHESWDSEWKKGSIPLYLALSCPTHGPLFRLSTDQQHWQLI